MKSVELVRRHERTETADHFLGLPAEDLHGACVPRAHATVEVEVDDRDRRRVDQRAVVLVGVLNLVELRRMVESSGRLVRERAQDLQALGVGTQPVVRVVGPDVADPTTAPVVERNEQPVVLPRVRPASISLRAVPHGAFRQQLARAVVRHQKATGHVELGLEHSLELVGGE